MNPDATDYLELRCTAEMVTVDADFDRCYEGHERAAWIRRCRLEQFRRLGLVIGKYWRDAAIAAITGGQRRPRRIGLYSGFCSRNRGRHWDRRRR